MKELNYEETVELEENIKLKNKAKEIYDNFLKNVKLEPKNYKGDGRFLFWSDSHNEIYFTIINDTFEYQCRFLHETYNVTVTPSGIFKALKAKSRGVEHLSCSVNNLQK